MGVVCLLKKITDQSGRDTATLVRRQDLNLHNAPFIQVSKEFEEPKFFRAATNYVCVVEAVAKTLPVSVLIG